MLISNLSETILFGKNFAKRLKPKSILLLEGPIGSGKTSFVQGLAEGLAITEQITSPTFALSHHYHSGKFPLIHMDLYRLTNVLSAEQLFLEEEEEANIIGAALVIEWPELISNLVEDYLKINISYCEGSGRNYEFQDSSLDKN